MLWIFDHITWSALVKAFQFSSAISLQQQYPSERPRGKRGTSETPPESFSEERTTVQLSTGSRVITFSM